MFGVKLSQAKTMFFDRPKVMRAMNDATRWSFSRFGAFVRTRARSSIRKRKKISQPDQPPSSHTAKLKDFIFFAYDERTRSEVIGAAPRGTSRAARALEHGGESTARTSTRRSRGVQTREVYIRKRPFMQPAFDKELPKAAPQFKGSMRGL